MKYFIKMCFDLGSSVNEAYDFKNAGRSKAVKDLVYYPGFETKNKNWLKFALLYFDTLRPIIPYTGCSEDRYLSEDFLLVKRETDLINPYCPDYEDGSCASIMACEEFEKYLRTPERYGYYFGNALSKNSIVDKWRAPKNQRYTLYWGKFTNDFFAFCVENRLATACDAGIRISEDLAFVYMSFLDN